MALQNEQHNARELANVRKLTSPLGMHQACACMHWACERGCVLRTLGEPHETHGACSGPALGVRGGICSGHALRRGATTDADYAPPAISAP